jgi:hypothetical protein
MSRMQLAKLCAGLLALVLVIGCSGADPNLIPEKSAPLGDNLRSGMTYEAIKNLDSLKGCTWTVREVERFGPTDNPKIPERVRTDASTDSCSHLGILGRMTLGFANDRLMVVEFTPDDAAAYVSALERELDRHVEVDKAYELEDGVILRVLDKNGKRVAIWQDGDLVAYFLSG